MRSSWKTKLVVAMAVAVVVVSLATGASAAVTSRAFATRASNASGSAGGFVALNDAGATGLAFTTTAAGKTVKITYNAECAAIGPAGSWVSVTILVDGVQANPASGTLFALCTEPISNAFVWTGAVRQSFIKLPNSGAHTVQVQVDLNNGATTWWLGDTSIAVEQQ